MAEIRVDVTAEDIAGGLPRYTCLCPVSQAISRVMNRRVSLVTRYVKQRCCLFIEFGGTRIPAPDAVRRWVERFDCGGSVKPFSFTLEVP